MKLFVIADHEKIKNGKTRTIDALAKACDERNIEMVILYPTEVNPFRIKIAPGDALYREATREKYGAVELETALIRPDIATFRTESTPMAVKDADKTVAYEFLGISAPKTLGYIPRDHQILLDVVEELGGFPIIIKAMGGSHGVGVIRVDSPESLFSVADFVRKSGTEAVLKEYCHVTSTARLIVLGDQVISSIEYSAPQGDFRSNEGSSPNVAPKKFSAEVEQLAIHATKVQGLEFSGVDIMLTETGPKVAEVNFPCFFPRCQMITHDDIAGQMVDYLQAKSRRILENS